MAITIALSATIRHGVNAGGSTWLYLTWALALQALGCRVIWLEQVERALPPLLRTAYHAALRATLAPYGLAGDIALCSVTGETLNPQQVGPYRPLEEAAAAADLFVNVGYFIRPEVVRAFRRSAWVDLDPGLSQLWMSSGDLAVPPHDVYFTIGETIGTAEGRVPDCGIRWHYTPMPVFLPGWPPTPAAATAPFTTVTNWWGEKDWMEWGGTWQSNEKRTAFLEYLDLPSKTVAPLELAVTLDSSAVDEQERRMLERHGWRVYRPPDRNWTPDAYRRYVQGSRGEFSCAKPFYVRLQTAILHDRTLHYLASGKPAVVQHTGPSRFLPDGEGLFRFRNPGEAVRALAAIEADYEHHSRAGRALAEEYFEGTRVLRRVLERALP